MAYLMVETSVRTHWKFLAAGPAASWLWLCGLGYCQEGLTDGFIPMSALGFLGVEAASSLALALVEVRLWEPVFEGQPMTGWHMHDYLDHNKSAKAIRALMRLRAGNGHRGGRPRKPSTKPSRLPIDETMMGNHSENPLLPSYRPTDLSDRPPDAPSDARARYPREPGLIDGAAIRRHGSHAWCANREGLCVPLFLHQEFVGKLGRLTADAELRHWYGRTLESVADRPIGEDALVFWRNSFASWVGTVSSRPNGESKGNATVAAVQRAIAKREAERQGNT